jgi:AcrR family transcriptional regulator
MTGQPAPEPSRLRRRSQAERRAETVERLLDATIATIAELGYHGATTVEICAHAGVTHGALFHHFDSKIDLVIAALQRMTEQRIGRYMEFAEEIQARAGHPLELLRMVGQLARDDVAIVWAEITVAARTDAELYERVGPAIETRWALIRAAASEFPGLAVMPERERDVWLQLMRGSIELAALVEPVLAIDDPQRREEHRNRALLRLAQHLGAKFPTG